jgi:poly(3-hydroxybutyrate) depolymerase
MAEAGGSASSGGAFGGSHSGGTSPTSNGGDGGKGGGAVKSAGCGKAAGASGARTIEVNGEAGAYLISVPPSYSATNAYPLGFAFHGYGRTHENCRDTDCRGFQSEIGDEAILVYMKSFTEGWEQPEVRDKNAAFFEKVLEQTKAEFCVDVERVFVAGTSSGASFTNLLACRYGDRLLAAAPVAGSLPESDCKENVAFVGLHGIDDPHVTFASGEAARDFFLAENGCGTTTSPPLTTVHANIRAARDTQTTAIECVDYGGCRSGLPVRWCEHSEGGYDNSTHGWPTDGGKLIWEFVKAL